MNRPRITASATPWQATLYPPGRETPPRCIQCLGIPEMWPRNPVPFWTGKEWMVSLFEVNEDGPGIGMRTLPSTPPCKEPKVCRCGTMVNP